MIYLGKKAVTETQTHKLILKHTNHAGLKLYSEYVVSCKILHNTSESVASAICVVISHTFVHSKYLFNIYFSEHIKCITKKISKTMGFLLKFLQILPRSSLLTIYKIFIRNQLDYADIIYDQAYNSAFHDKLESTQYNACLAITGAIRGTSTKKIYHKLGLESLKSRRWFRKLCHFYKIFNETSVFI